jgi:pyruvate, orthophosphate dikinase
MAKKHVYFFGPGVAEGHKGMKDFLGGKGANLAEMAGIGLPVPAGFTVSTEVCGLFYGNRKRIPEAVRKEIVRNLARLEKAAGKKLGDPADPLLVSIRSGARASMPGMMDTVLNLGLNDRAAAALVAKTGNPRFVYDSYRRFVQMYGDVVLGLRPVDKDDIDPFEAIMERKKRERGVHDDTDLTADDLKDLVARYKAAIKDRTGHEFPDDPIKQLWGAIGAVFNSWMNERAIAYRKLYDIPESWGTAVNVQMMVFGNMGPDSGTGVAFTRDAATGENVYYGEYLMNAQGEDVVAGTRTPLPITHLKKDDPRSYAELERIRHVLERHFREMMDIEFTIERGRLYMLQCRTGKRTAFAAIKIAVDMVDEKLIGEKEALTRIEPDQLNQLLRPVFDPAEKDAAVKGGRLLTRGLNAGPGAATGRIVFNSLDAELWAKHHEKVILTRIETSPEDIKGMSVAEGILTARGGMTSHAALVARQMGKVCVAGCGELAIDYGRRTVTVHGKVLKEGDWISIDGTTGQVLQGQVHTRPSEVLQVLIDRTLDPSEAPVYRTFAKIMKWADKYRTLKVRTNADQPDQSRNAVAFGAEGIGLCRTEHMFFGEGKIGPMREMILADTLEARQAALAKLLPLQRQDFAGIFEVMGGRPVTIRTIDPPLHEFLPHEEKDQRELAEAMGIPYEKVRDRVASLHEFNPMLGLRGCRLGIIYPEITEMQARAVFEAAAETKKKGLGVEPEVMIPLVGHVKELENQALVVRRVAEAVMKEQGVRFKYLVGTMIEIPRGALTADEIAGAAEFFSFGTNDLTQTALGLSRDDAGRFLFAYLQKDIYPKDPFEVIDRTGVGQLMRTAVDKGRRARPGIKLGICGEHGGDPSSIEFCHLIGLDYVSCSPFRVPIARLAAARAALANPAPAGRSGRAKAKGKAKAAKPAASKRKPARKR